MKQKKRYMLSVILIVAAFLVGYFVKSNMEKPDGVGEKIDYQSISDGNTILDDKVGYYGYEDRKETPSKDLSLAIIKYVCDSSDQEFECDDKDKDNNDISVYHYDLNNDGEQEFIAMPFQVYGKVIRGASGNGTILVLQQQDSQWVVIGDFMGNGYFVSDTTNDGYHDILVNFHSSAFSGVETLYKWQKDYSDRHSYEEIFTKWYRLKVPASVTGNDGL